MTEEVKRKYERGIEEVTAQELEERLEEVTNLVRFKSQFKSRAA
jgi:hypothetical protein